MLDIARRGGGALLVAATGSGKTLAGFLPTICDLIDGRATGSTRSTCRRSRRSGSTSSATCWPDL
jgi:Lhr-like helicase